jgi:hypothetical protein
VQQCTRTDVHPGGEAAGRVCAQVELRRWEGAAVVGEHPGMAQAGVQQLAGGGAGREDMGTTFDALLGMTGVRLLPHRDLI